MENIPDRMHENVLTELRNEILLTNYHVPGVGHLTLKMLLVQIPSLYGLYALSPPPPALH